MPIEGAMKKMEDLVRGIWSKDTRMAEKIQTPAVALTKGARSGG